MHRDQAFEAMKSISGFVTFPSDREERISYAMNSCGFVIPQEENTFDVRLNHNRIENIILKSPKCY